MGNHAAVPAQDEVVARPPVVVRGSFEPYSIGDPGHAPKHVVAAPDPLYWNRPDIAADGVALHDADDRLAVHLRAASIRGLAHQHYGRVRQDEYSFRLTSNRRYLVIAVTDGVSAGRHSHMAATFVAQGGTAELCRLLETVAADELCWGAFIEDMAERLVVRGREFLRSSLGDRAVELTMREVAHHMATTALYAVMDLRRGDGGFPVWTVQVGDTSAWVLDESGAWQPQRPVKNAGADLHSADVVALPLMPARPIEPIRTSVDAGQALLLMTDGVGDPLGDGTGSVGAALASALAAPPAALEFAAQTAFAKRSFDDDRTVVGIWPAASP